MERGESTFIKETTGIYLRDVYDHTIQVIDTVETFRDMISGMLDFYLSSLSNKMNEVMKLRKKSRLRLNLPEKGKIRTVFGFINPFKDLDVSLEVLKEVKEGAEDVYLFIAGGLPPGASKKS